MTTKRRICFTFKLNSLNIFRSVRFEDWSRTFCSRNTLVRAKASKFAVYTSFAIRFVKKWKHPLKNGNASRKRGFDETWTNKSRECVYARNLLKHKIFKQIFNQLLRKYTYIHIHAAEYFFEPIILFTYEFQSCKYFVAIAILGINRSRTTT